jgi:hypothetical protein
MATLIKCLEKVSETFFAFILAALFFTIGVTILLGILAKGFIRSVKQGGK